MLQFSNLKILNKHYQYLQKKLNNDAIFLVGGCVRDLLLGIKSDPKDIDLTLA
ncbi:MAG: hypothetical protein GXP45_07300 [bacterium]|nr:hypothetical protein [bacterium]